MHLFFPLLSNCNNEYNKSKKIKKNLVLKTDTENGLEEYFEDIALKMKAKNSKLINVAKKNKNTTDKKLKFDKFLLDRENEEKRKEKMELAKIRLKVSLNKTYTPFQFTENIRKEREKLYQQKINIILSGGLLPVKEFNKIQNRLLMLNAKERKFNLGLNPYYNGTDFYSKIINEENRCKYIKNQNKIKKSPLDDINELKYLENKVSSLDEFDDYSSLQKAARDCTGIGLFKLMNMKKNSIKKQNQSLKIKPKNTLNGLLFTTEGNEQSSEEDTKRIIKISKNINKNELNTSKESLNKSKEKKKNSKSFHFERPKANSEIPKKIHKSSFNASEEIKPFLSEFKEENKEEKVIDIDEQKRENDKEKAAGIFDMFKKANMMMTSNDVLSYMNQ